MNSEIDLLKAQIAALKFSESVQKDRADRLEVECRKLSDENQKAMSELKDAKMRIDELVPMQEQNKVKRFVTSWFSTMFSILQLSQEILDKLFPSDQTVHATVIGTSMRKVFEFVTRSLLPLDFFNSKDSIDIKIHSSIDQFMEFAKAFAKFIYALEMQLPGNSVFIVCGMDEPKKVQRILSNDGHRVYEATKFVVSFYCRNTKRKHKLVFSCDTGFTFPQEDFDVNSITLDTVRGFDTCVHGPHIPILQIIMGIMNQRAQWNQLPNSHFSGLEKVLAMKGGYVLHGCPSVTKTDFCPLLQDKSKYALEFSGCKCNLDRCISIEMLLGFFKSERENHTLRCPFCKEILQNLAHEPDYDSSVFFDLSCIDTVLKTEELRNSQEDGRSIPRILGLNTSPLTEIEQIRESLASFAKVRHSWSILQDLPILSKDDAALFFPFNPDEESDPEPEAESDDDQDDQDDQEDLEDLEDHEYTDDQDDQDDRDYRDYRDYQDDQDDLEDQEDQGDLLEIDGNVSDDSTYDCIFLP